jgi:MFS family permease
MADRFGPRIVLAAAIAWWFVFTAASGLSFSAFSLAITRLLFGAGEAAAMPAGSQALVRWLPFEQRAFGQGFQHSGARLGAALAPAVVVSLMAFFGWRSVFFIFGSAGVLWATAWYVYYRNSPSEHPKTNSAEIELLPKTSEKSAHREAARTLAANPTQPRSLVFEHGLLLLWMGHLAVSGLVPVLPSRSAPLYCALDRSRERPAPGRDSHECRWRRPIR